MESFLLWHNGLDGATVTGYDTAQAGFEGEKCNDYRLDTGYKPATAGVREVDFDMQQTVSTGKSPVDTTNYDDRIRLAYSDLKEEGCYVNDYWEYTITLDSGAGAGQSKKVIGHVNNDNADHQKDFTLQVESDWITNPDETTVYTITRIPICDCVCVAGANRTGKDWRFRAVWGATSPANDESLTIYSMTGNRPFAYVLNSPKTFRYFRAQMRDVDGVDDVLPVVMVGKRTNLSLQFDEMANRAPYKKLGFNRSVKNRFNLSNAGGFFPASVVPQMFDDNLRFKHVREDFLRLQRGAGMFDHLIQKPFFVGSEFSPINATEEVSEIYDVAYCQMSGDMPVPTLPDYNGRFDLNIPVKVFAGV